MYHVYLHELTNFHDNTLRYAFWEKRSHFGKKSTESQGNLIVV